MNFAKTSNSISSAQQKRNLVSDAFVKLLAGENVTVFRHNKAAAYFDLKNRTIHVPNWDFTSLGYTSAEDLMNCHEVFHALYTPDDHKVNDILNIVEDNRIERLGKQRYPGLRKVFLDGYRQLNVDMDFFGIKDMSVKQLNDLNFLDRLNLVSKLGSQLGIEFKNDSEKELVNRCNTVTTFDEVLKLVEDIKSYLRSQKEDDEQEQLKSLTMRKMQNEDAGDESGESTGSSESEMGEEIQDLLDSLNEFLSSKDGDGDSNKEDGDSSDGNGEDSEDSDDNKQDKESSDMGGRGYAQMQSDDEDDELFKSQTIRSFEKNTNKRIERKMSQTAENILVDSMNPAFLKLLDTVTLQELQNKVMGDKISEGYKSQNAYVQDLFNKTMQQANRGAMILHKEFSMKKNAKERRLDKVESTGKLDMDRVHLYKLSENIFRSRLTRFTGENHGFVFLIDCSGSMDGARIISTIQQTFMTVEFCRKMGIKYRVYLYSSGAVPSENFTRIRGIREFKAGNCNMMKSDENNEGASIYTPALITVMDYTQKTQVHKKSCELLFNTLCIPSGYRHIVPTYGVNVFGGTSTGAAIMAIENEAREFFDRNKIEKRNIVVMTDGHSNCRFHSADGYGKPYTSKFIVDNITKRTYRPESSDHTDIALDMLKHRLNANTILIQLASSITDGFSSGIVRSAFNSNVFHDTLQKSFIRNKFVESKTHSLIDSVFIIRMNKELCDETDYDEVTADAQNKTAKQLANKLISATKAERVSRVLMQSLAESFN